jgi:hypothetical protein
MAELDKYYEALALTGAYEEKLRAALDAEGGEGAALHEKAESFLKSGLFGLGSQLELYKNAGAGALLLAAIGGLMTRNRKGVEAGIALGMGLETYNAEAGMAYLQYITEGQDPESAAKDASTAGMANAALEMGNIFLLLENPAGKGLSKLVAQVNPERVARMLARTVLSKLPKGAVRGAASVGGTVIAMGGVETGQEALQRYITDTMQGFSSDDKSLRISAADRLEGMKEEAWMAAPTSFMFGLAGGARQAVSLYGEGRASKEAARQFRAASMAAR